MRMGTLGILARVLTFTLTLTLMSALTALNLIAATPMPSANETGAIRDSELPVLIRQIRQAVLEVEQVSMLWASDPAVTAQTEQGTPLDIPLTGSERARLLTYWETLSTKLLFLKDVSGRWARHGADLANIRETDISAIERELAGVVSVASGITHTNRFLSAVRKRARLKALILEVHPGDWSSLMQRMLDPAALARLHDIQKTRFWKKILVFYAPGGAAELNASTLADAERWMFRFMLENDDTLQAAIHQLRQSESWLKQSFSESFAAFFRELYLPVLTAISNFIGETVINPNDQHLIHDEQIAEFTALLEPGDILWERRNWKLSTLFISDFWTHALLYLGTPEQAAAFFDTPEIRAHYRRQGYSGFVQAISAKLPKTMQTWRSKDAEGKPMVVIEAIRPGVMLNSSLDAFRADYVAAVRPKLSRLDRALALETALQWHGRPYDFEFRLHSNTELYCSELVAKAYQPDSAAGKGGLVWPLEVLPNRNKGYSPAGILRGLLQGESLNPARAAFVAFLMGSEKDQAAFFMDERTLGKSWTWKGLVKPQNGWKTTEALDGFDR